MLSKTKTCLLLSYIQRIVKGTQEITSYRIVIFKYKYRDTIAEAYNISEEVYIMKKVVLSFYLIAVFGEKFSCVSEKLLTLK